MKWSINCEMLYLQFHFFWFAPHHLCHHPFFLLTKLSLSFCPVSHEKVRYTSVEVWHAVKTRKPTYFFAFWEREAIGWSQARKKNCKIPWGKVRQLQNTKAIPLPPTSTTVFSLMSVRGALEIEIKSLSLFTVFLPLFLWKLFFFF